MNACIDKYEIFLQYSSAFVRLLLKVRKKNTFMNETQHFLLPAIHRDRVCGVWWPRECSSLAQEYYSLKFWPKELGKSPVYRSYINIYIMSSKRGTYRK